MKRIVFSLLTLSIVIGALLSVNAARQDPETKTIIKVIEEATLIPDQVYTKAFSFYKKGDLAANRLLLLNEGHSSMQRIFTTELASRLSKGWIEDQFSNVKEGPEQIGFGVTNTEIKELSIADDQAQVTALVEKYMVDRVYRDGKFYLDRLDGAILTRATLIKINGVWKISKYESEPDFSYSKHTVTPE